MNCDREYLCPNCGAILNNQYGFDLDNEEWVCTECGYTYTFSEDENQDTSTEEKSNFDKVLDATNSILDLATLGLQIFAAVKGVDLEDYNDESSDNEDEEEHEDEEEYNTIDDSEILFEKTREDEARQSSDTFSHTKYQSSVSSSYENYSSSFIFENIIKKIGLILIVLLLFFLMGYGIINLNEDKVENHPGEVKLTYSASSYKNENYYDAIIKLKKQGLSDIRLTALEDLKTGILVKEGRIAKIQLNGISDFKAKTWVSENSVVSISYHSFEKKKVHGYDTDKNSHLIISGVDISLPSYMIVDSQEATNAVCHVKGDETTKLDIFLDNKREWNDINNYDTHHILKEEKISSIGVLGKEIIALGKINDKVYSIDVKTLATKVDTSFLHLSMVSLDTNKNDYSADFEKIVSGIYFPDASEIRIDFYLKDYKGHDYEDVVSELHDKGFKNIQVKNLKDIVFGILAKENTVENIIINENTDYKVGDWISDESKILITFHGK